MQKRFKIILILFLLAFTACSTTKRVGPGSMLSPKKIPRYAVLDFEQDGLIGGNKLGIFAADYLTNLLFERKKQQVIDRAQIRAAVTVQNVSNLALSPVLVKKLGVHLNADYIILGKLVRLNKPVFSESGNELDMEITIRVLSVHNGTLVDLASKRSKKKKQAKYLIRSIMGKLIKSIDPEETLSSK
ncbi:MAG: hypothetical protein H6696_14385 [Deferribacteres bacterium]|nr:hypothetical protein [candidate division KSB1 bacterium]MCB9503116.1 hypothetical protein [Deferribacteres bacterium]